MKKILTILLTLVLVCTLVGCGKNDLVGTDVTTNSKVLVAKDNTVMTAAMLIANSTVSEKLLEMANKGDITILPEDTTLKIVEADEENDLFTIKVANGEHSGLEGVVSITKLNESIYK